MDNTVFVKYIGVEVSLCNLFLVEDAKHLKTPDLSNKVIIKIYRKKIRNKIYRDKINWIA